MKQCSIRVLPLYNSVEQTIRRLFQAMLPGRFTFPKRYAVLLMPLSVPVFGILSAYAVPGSEGRMVPIAAKSATPSGAKAPGAGSKARDSSKPARSLSSRQTTATSTQQSGEQIYRQMCISCHGVNGQGGKVFKGPLVGDRSIGQLARFIRLEMPPGRPTKLPVEDARRVAEYIHGAFYSPLARARNKPARVELSRLTVRQYRNAVTDLIGSFRAARQPDERRGLAAKYFKTQRNGQPILERVDSQIRFDFKTAGALPEQDDPYQFAMSWEGSVLAPDTGEYEFVVRTEQGATMWLNDLRQPLIDAQVKSGNSNEYRASVFLLGGRRYPLRLEFFKGVQGVNDLKKLKEKPPQNASLALEWKMPKRAGEVIPQRFLSPVVTAEVFVPVTPFPPDDRSVGYERGTSVSKEWVEAATEAALETTAYVTTHLSELSGVADDAKDRNERLREFCRKFVARAFRRPLSSEQMRLYVDRHFAGGNNQSADTELAVKRAVLLALTSPQFLYRETGVLETRATPSESAPAAVLPAAALKKTAANDSGAPTTGKTTPVSSATSTSDAYDVASRLSFVMWDSLPDEQLLKAAAAGELATREQVMQQAQRMATDPRAWFKMKEFLLQWLKVDHYPDLAKNPRRFPKFNEFVASDLRTSLEMSLEDIAWSEKTGFLELMLTDKFFLNGRLASVYGVSLAPDAPFQMVALDPGKRSGILTHPYILASFGYLDTSSPIHRGVLIARNFLGRQLRQPPAAFTPIAANLHPKLTTRQRVALQTRPSACASCHTLINPLGFSLETFDAIGSLRDLENGMPVDATGSYLSPYGQEVKFAGSTDLTRFLANSEEVHTAFVERLFQNMVKQPVRAYGPRTLTDLRQIFKVNRFNIRRQMIETAVVAALYGSNVSSSAAKKPGDAAGAIANQTAGDTKSAVKATSAANAGGVPRT
jgi:mono/diheme cytochrome c family protein